MSDSRLAAEWGWNCVFIAPNCVFAYRESLCLTNTSNTDCVKIASSLRRIGFLTSQEPASCPGDSFYLDSAIAFQLTQQGLYLVTAEAREDLLEFFKPGTRLG